jgi:predicted aspartyl protease
MKIRIERRHSPFGETHRRKYSTWFWLNRGIVLSTVALLISSVAPCWGLLSARDTESAKERAEAEVPFELYNGNLIIVKATIGRVKNVNMILDTGTSPTAISKAIADRLKLQGRTESLQTLARVIQTRSVILPRIQIGPLDAKSIRVILQDLTFMERSLGISLGGIAGLDILSTDSFTIDYHRRKIAFGSITASEKAVRFETQVPFLTITAKIEGQKIRLLVDSGTWGLLLYRNRLGTAAGQLLSDSNASISTVGGMTHVRWLSAEVSLGKNDLGACNVAVVDLDSESQNHFDGLLGFAKMGFRKVSFDFKNGLFGWE